MTQKWPVVSRTRRPTQHCLRAKTNQRPGTADPIAAAEGSNLLVKLDLALDLKRETDPAERHCRLCREPLVALEFTLLQSLSYCLLDLALGCHTQPLEKLADAGVENVFVHHHLHVAAGGWPQQHI